MIQHTAVIYCCSACLACIRALELVKNIGPSVTIIVKETENIAKRRALEVQNVQRLNQDAVGPKAREGGKRSRVEGGVAKAARP